MQKTVLSVILVVASTMALAQNPVPFINQPLVPMTATPGGAEFTLTVNGTGFVAGSVVNWNGTALVTTFVSSSQLSATVPASNIATASTASITVSNPPPGGGTSDVVFFDVAAPPANLTFTQLPPNSPFPAGLPIAQDFNGDGKLDLAYLAFSLTSNNVIVQLGNGDGSFQAPVTYSAGITPAALVAGDFDGDGKLDLAVVNTQDNTVHSFSAMATVTSSSRVQPPQLLLRNPWSRVISMGMENLILPPPSAPQVVVLVVFPYS